MKLTETSRQSWLIGMIAHLLSSRLAKTAIVAASSVVLYGCELPQDALGPRELASATPQASPRDPQRTGNSRAAAPSTAVSAPQAKQEPVATFVDARPAAMIDGKAVNWGDLRPTLTDLAGAEALRELVIDRKLEAALAERAIVIGESDIVGERKLLLESLSSDANTAIRLLDELRDRQNLGRSRFEALLRRNAGLRALVRGDVKLDDNALRIMHDIVHGPKRQARIMVLPDLATAQAAINLVNSGASFADVAVEMSDDPSAARGGLLEPISQSDPNYPDALRQTLFSLNTGAMSGPVLLGDRYAVVLLFKRIAHDGITLDDARPALERMVRISQERLLMDQLLRRLTLDVTVTVFDDQLNESWQRARRTR